MALDKNLLTAEHISKSFTDKILLDDVSFGVNEHDKVGVIGINGTGKSTLLKIIAGLEYANSGEIKKGNKVRIEYLPQTPVFDDTKSILENVLHEKQPEEEYRNLEGEATAMLQRFGIFNIHESAKHLSGGQRKRAALVRTLLTPAEILVLDEPTNHLDNAMTVWLQEYLNKFKGAFLMVTHDRYFLDRVTNKILEIDKSKIYLYETNYSGFVSRKAEREESLLATERKAKTLYRSELAWMQRGARARSTKQKAHIQRFEELKNRDKIQKDEQIAIDSVSTRLGRTTIEMNHVSKSFSVHGQEKCLIRDFSYILLPKDRLGIIGPNGCGKSTLLKMITGKIQPDSGEIIIGQTVKIGYFAQETEEMDQTEKVIDYIRDTEEYIQTSDGVATASQMLEKFLFTGSMQYSLIEKLSGGERRRLYLLKILMEQPNILILDEPTNDLDIATLTILEDYLKRFDGIVLTVSHDRYFLDKIVQRLFVYSADGSGKITQLEGSYSENESKIRDLGGLTEIGKEYDTEKKEINKTNWKEGQKTESSKPKLSYNEKREYDSLETEINSLEEKIAKLEEKIAESVSNYSKLQEYMDEKNELEAQLEYKMERWMYFETILG